VERLLSLGLQLSQTEPRPRTVLYARVSTRKQEAFLKAQVARLEAFSWERGGSYETVAEVAGGGQREPAGPPQDPEPGQQGGAGPGGGGVRDRLARFGLGYIRLFPEAFGVSYHQRKRATCPRPKGRHLPSVPRA